MTTATTDPRTIRAPRGAEMSCKGWQQEAALRMLMNNLDPDVAELPEQLIVYGGSGRAARSWPDFDRIVATLRRLENDETMLVQSGRAVGVLKTHPDAPRVLISNSMLVPKWATWDEFRRLEAAGLTMFGQMTAGSWIYIGSQGILQGTYETFAALARKHFGEQGTGNGERGTGGERGAASRERETGEDCGTGVSPVNRGTDTSPEACGTGISPVDCGTGYQPVDSEANPDCGTGFQPVSSGTLQHRLVVTGGLGGMGGAQPLAATFNGAACLCVEVDRERIEKRIATKYLDRWTADLDEALDWVLAAKQSGEALSVGLLANIADVLPELIKRDITPDVLTDQTSAHDPVGGYVPNNMSYEAALALRESDPAKYEAESFRTMGEHIAAMLELQSRGAITFDYGNNLRGHAQEAVKSGLFDPKSMEWGAGSREQGARNDARHSANARESSPPSSLRHSVTPSLDSPACGAGFQPVKPACGTGVSPVDFDPFKIPGFVPEYIRPLFCEGAGPFRWAAISGDPNDIAVTDQAVLDTFPEEDHLCRWIRMAGEKVAFQGLPCRICWLKYGQRAKMGLIFNRLVREGKTAGPIVLGRDHLDCGSVASPNRETEAMKDGSDAIADWPILNALANTACGATWVSVHHGGGVGIGYSIHAGQVIVCDGTPEANKRIERVLTADPAMGVIRHADAGYELARDVAREKGVDLGGC